MVQEAFDRELGRPVAVRALRAARRTERTLRRFRREAAVARDTASPRRVPVLDIGHAGEALVLTMGLVTGESLQVRMERSRREVGEVLGILREFLGWLQVLHALGIAHRDVGAGERPPCRGRPCGARRLRPRPAPLGRRVARDRDRGAPRPRGRARAATDPAAGPDRALAVAGDLGPPEGAALGPGGKTPSFLSPSTGAAERTVQLAAPGAETLAGFALRFVVASLQTVDIEGRGTEVLVATSWHRTFPPSYLVDHDPWRNGSRLLFLGSGHHEAIGAAASSSTGCSTRSAR